MAINIVRFIGSLDSGPATGQEFLERCHQHGIDESITLAVLSSSDVREVCDGLPEASFTFATAAQTTAKKLVQ